MEDTIKKTFTCIICPVGCQIDVRGIPGKTTLVEGNDCERGIKYAKEEYCHPTRILTSSVLVKGARTPLIPVRSNEPVPKERIQDCMKVIKETVVYPPVRLHDIVIPDILGTGIHIVATSDAE